MSNALFVPWGQTICLSPTQERGGGKHLSQTGGGDKHFYIEGGTNILPGQGGQTFYVGGGGAYDDDSEEMDVSEANFLVSEASKLSVGARILGARRALKF